MPNPIQQKELKHTARSGLEESGKFTTFEKNNLSSLTTLYPVSDEELDMLNEIHDYLTSEGFDVEFNTLKPFEKNNFFSLSHYKNVHVSLDFKVTKEKKSFHILVVNLQYISIGGKSGDHQNVENQIMGIAEVKNAPQFLLRKEKLSDKINDIFMNIDIDFKDDKLFSSEFLLNAPDKAKVKSFLTAERREQILKFGKSDDIIIESSTNLVLVKSLKPLQLDCAKSLIQFINQFI